MQVLITYGQESLANAKVSVQQQCVYAKKSMANQHNEHNGKVHSMGYNTVADNSGLSSFD